MREGTRDEEQGTRVSVRKHSKIFSCSDYKQQALSPMQRCCTTRPLSLALLLLILLSSFFAPCANAQTSSAYLIPRQIHVGDPAVLVLPLPAAETDSDTVLTPDSPIFPFHENIDFHRIILEQRTSGCRLIVEFTAFASGVLEFPEIVIAQNIYSGLSVSVNSLIDSESTLVLARPAASLSMPGTTGMLYTAMALIVFLILFSLWFILKGRMYLQKLSVSWKRRRMFSSMKKFEKRLYRNAEKGGEKREILDKMSKEFRNFLSLLTGINCRSMTARDFEQTQFEIFESNKFKVSLLGDFFSSCDNFRFSGIEAGAKDILCLLENMRLIITELEAAGKRKIPEKEAA